MSRSLKQPLVAVEGACFAGKTTLVRQLSRMLGGVAIPEYSELAPLPPFPPSTDDEVRAAIVSLRELEILRRACAAAQPCKVAVFDRSPLSCIAFQYAVRCLGVPCDHHLTVDLFVAAAREGRIAVPHLYIHLDVDRRTALTRRYERGPVAPHLMNPWVVDRMNHAYRFFLGRLPADRGLILDGTLPHASLTERAASFVTASRTDREVPAAAWSCLKELP